LYRFDRLPGIVFQKKTVFEAKIISIHLRYAKTWTQINIFEGVCNISFVPPISFRVEENLWSTIEEKTVFLFKLS
jgi:hypothetical protein